MGSNLAELPQRHSLRQETGTSQPNRLFLVRPPEVHDKVVKLFNLLGERSADNGGNVKYDRHMGQDTNHDHRMKQAIDILRSRIFHKKLRIKDEIRMITIGGGTGSIESHFVRNTLLPHLKAHDSTTLTLVHVDEAENMVSTAMDKYASILMQANGAQSRLNFVPLVAGAETLNHPDILADNPELGKGFDIAIASYVEAWFRDKRLAFSNIRGLLTVRDGRLLSIEEDPLLFTPSTSIPSDSEFARLIIEIATQCHLHPHELYGVLKTLGFKIKGKYQLGPMAIDQDHSLYAAVLLLNQNFNPVATSQPE